MTPGHGLLEVGRLRQVVQEIAGPDEAVERGDIAGRGQFAAERSVPGQVGQLLVVSPGELAITASSRPWCTTSLPSMGSMIAESPLASSIARWHPSPDHESSSRRFWMSATASTASSRSRNCPGRTGPTWVRDGRPVIRRFPAGVVQVQRVRCQARGVHSVDGSGPPHAQCDTGKSGGPAEGTRSGVTGRSIPAGRLQRSGSSLTAQSIVRLTTVAILLVDQRMRVHIRGTLPYVINNYIG